MNKYRRMNLIGLTKRNLIAAQKKYFLIDVKSFLALCKLFTFSFDFNDLLV
jgi:hypothetical protein